MDDRYQTGMTPPPFDRVGPTGELSQVALWSMILGILSFCFGPLGLVALITRAKVMARYNAALDEE